MFDAVRAPPKAACPPAVRHPRPNPAPPGNPGITDRSIPATPGRTIPLKINYRIPRSTRPLAADRGLSAGYVNGDYLWLPRWVAGVFGVVHGIDDEVANVFVLQFVEDLGAVPAVRTSRAIRSLARCWDTDGPGFPIAVARSPSGISRSIRARFRGCRRFSVG